MNKSKNRSFDGKLYTYQQTAEKTNLGMNTVMRLARESGALIKIGKSARVDWETFYDYISCVYRVGK